MLGSRALFIGRFQPFHKGHLKALQKLVASYFEVIVVIGSSNQNFTVQNPLTISERLQLLRKVIEHEKWEKKISYLLPFPDMTDNIVWTRLLVDLLPPFDAVCCGNYDNVLQFFEHLQYRTERLPFLDRIRLQGTVIRTRIQEGKEWESAIPTYLLPLLLSFHFKERLMKP